MCRIYTLLLLIIFVFFSCDKKQKQEKQKKEISFKEPVAILASQPNVSLLDTCPKPNTFVVPVQSSIDFTIQTKKGPITVPFFSKKIPVLPDEAGGFTNIQNFNTEQGLALSTITCGYKDKTGNLWFGTSGGGVSKYDGKSFTNFNTIQGLAHTIVKSIIEDKKGNIWIGTNGGGVSRYDGRYFKNFSTDQGLIGRRVLCITEDLSGNLWFGTDMGISKYNPDLNRGISKSLPDGQKDFTNYTVTQGLASNNVSSCVTDKKGNIWFGTDKGVSKFPTGMKEGSGAKLFINYSMDQGLISNLVTSIIEDKKGNMWFGTWAGISKYNPVTQGKTGGGVFTNFNHGQGLLDDNIFRITEDKSGNLWFGSSFGISTFAPTLKTESPTKLFTNFSYAQGLFNNSVSCIVEDKTGSLWIGSSSGGGLNKYDGKSFASYTIAQGLVHDKVWSITEDNKGNLWFTANGGISKYDHTSFTNFKLDNILIHVRCILEDKRGNIWFGSSSGVSKYDGKFLTSYSVAQGIPEAVLSIAEDKTGNLWFGTYGAGVVKYDGNRVEAIEKGEKLHFSNKQDLKKINGKFVKSFTNYTVSQGLAENTIKCIIADKIGNIWFGTNGNGVSKFDGTSFINYSRANGLPHNTIYSMLEDKAGTIWIGTAGGGVCCYSPSEKSGNTPFFKTYSTSQGLADDVVYAIIEDTLNNKIWFGTNLGLSGLKISSLSSKVEEAKFENFNNTTGYPIKDINTGALFLDTRGIIWAGTSEKLMRFDYSGIHKSDERPAVFIQAVKIQGENVGWYSLNSQQLNITKMSESDSSAILNEEIITNDHLLTEIVRDSIRKKFNDIKFDSITPFYPVPSNLVLPFANNNITFDFLAIETTRPLMVKYQYMLEGYDKDWSPLTDKTTASFGNISEGEYTFKLKARSPDGVWSAPVMYTFKVLPPWYRTWWMYSCYLLAFLTSIGLFFRLRTASLRKEKEVLERTVKERTTEVVEQKELIEEKQKEIVDSINYAKRIQYALLANDSLLQQNLKEHFILFQPKDIVSGDFYWAAKISQPQPSQREGAQALLAIDGVDSNPSPSGELEGAFYLAICDSTGHGVPGAFMSLLNISFLNEAITEKNIKLPNEILNHVRQRLIESVSQDGAQDGMDGILLCFEKGKITYAAANNAPVILRDHLIIILPSDKMPIGKGEKNSSFTLHTIDSKKGDMLYFYTDGYADQFGGPKGKKFKYKQLEELLISIEQKSMEDQKKTLTTTIENWKGNLEQVDDILIFGMRV